MNKCVSNDEIVHELFHNFIFLEMFKHNSFERYIITTLPWPHAHLKFTSFQPVPI